MISRATSVFLLTLGSSAAQAAVLNFDTSITGADMGGINVTATFADNTYETLTWASLTSTMGDKGGVESTNWSLTQQGYTLGNFDAGNIYGAWSFTDDDSNITGLKIDTAGTDIMFDTVMFDSLLQDTNGSGQGRSFIADKAGITASYSGNVQQELYKILEVSGLTGDNFTFLADTDKQDDDATAVVVIDVQDVLVPDDVLGAVDINKVNEIVNVAPVDSGISVYLAANTANTEEKLLEAVENLNITALPAKDTLSAEEELLLVAAIQVAQETIKIKLKETSVTGNGDIDVEIDRESGKLAIALTVANPDTPDAPLNYITLIDTPESAFSISFDFNFTTATGKFFGYLAGDDLFSYDATDYYGSPVFGSFFIDDSKYFGLTAAELKYSLFPGSPAGGTLSNLNITTVQPTVDVPEPSTILILMSGLLGLVVNRKKLAGK